jgi:hypothetical protein
VPASAASSVAHLPPVSILFAAFLGYNPIQHLVGASVLSHVPATQQAALTGRSFFPTLISRAFKNGLDLAFDFSIAASVLAALASWTRGKHVPPLEAVVYVPVDAEAAAVSRVESP